MIFVEKVNTQVLDDEWYESVNGKHWSGEFIVIITGVVAYS